MKNREKKIEYPYVFCPHRGRKSEVTRLRFRQPIKDIWAGFCNADEGALAILLAMALFVMSTGLSVVSAQTRATNPIIYADVPDASMIRVGDTYYMSSTTMHMNPGVPIMKSKDLINWEIVNYAYETLGDNDALNLVNGKNAYGKGSWASCLRYVDGTYYVSTFSSTTGKTYIFSTPDIEKGKWEAKSFEPSYHDNSLFFDDDGKVYLIWGAGELHMVELKKDLSGIVEGTERVLIENASAPANADIMLAAEGSQMFKIDGKYYLFNICWPRGGMRTVIVHRADNITGPYEGRLALQDKGVAQGGLISTPEGAWYAFLFQDHGAVGRIPYLVPVTWEHQWPVLGTDGKVPMTLDLPANRSLIPGIVRSDEFNRSPDDLKLPLVWQWNHNPNNDNWSVSARKGYLRLSTSRLDNDIEQAQNILTQRTIGPQCTASTAIDLSNMKNGDITGLTLFAEFYGYVGVKKEEGTLSIFMKSSTGEQPVDVKVLPDNQETIYLKAMCDYRDRRDAGFFYYSLDGHSWNPIGNELKMRYTLGHFMGYRFGLFHYATEHTGGFVDFDYFRIRDQLDAPMAN